MANHMRVGSGTTSSSGQAASASKRLDAHLFALKPDARLRSAVERSQGDSSTKPSAK